MMTITAASSVSSSRARASPNGSSHERRTSSPTVNCLPAASCKARISMAGWRSPTTTSSKGVSSRTAIIRMQASTRRTASTPRAGAASTACPASDGNNLPGTLSSSPPTESISMMSSAHSSITDGSGSSEALRHRDVATVSATAQWRSAFSETVPLLFRRSVPMASMARSTPRAPATSTLPAHAASSTVASSCSGPSPSQVLLNSRCAWSGDRPCNAACGVAFSSVVRCASRAFSASSDGKEPCSDSLSRSRKIALSSG